MEEKIIYKIPAIYRDDFRIRAFSFGSGEKSACIVGSMRGNENQQLFACSMLVKELKRLERGKDSKRKGSVSGSLFESLFHQYQEAVLAD